VLQFVDLCCGVSQCVSVCCSMLQRVAVRCIVINTMCVVIGVEYVYMLNIYAEQSVILSSMLKVLFSHLYKIRLEMPTIQQYVAVCCSVL